MKKILLFCFFVINLSTAIKAQDNFSDSSIGSQIATVIVSIIIYGILTSPIWGLIWYIVRKIKKAKERKERRKAYYAKQLEEKQQQEERRKAYDSKQLEEKQQQEERRKAYYAKQLEEKQQQEEKRKEYDSKLLEEKNRIELNGLEQLRKTKELTKQKEKILEVNLAGLYYRPKKAHEIARYLNVGDRLELKRNPSNQYDNFAVKVMAYGTHIGFIPKVYSEKVFNEISKKDGYRVFVLDTDKDDIPHINIILFPFELKNGQYSFENTIVESSE